jgi:hypothetical protein
MKFYINTFTYILYGSIIGLFLTDVHKNFIKAYDSFEKIWLGTLETILILYFLSILIQIVKSIQNKPILTLTDEALIEHKIGLVLNWENIISINKEGYKNTYIEIILREPYSNFDTIRNPLNKLYYKVKHKLRMKNTSIYLTYIKGNDDEIVNLINDYKNSLKEQEN